MPPKKQIDQDQRLRQSAAALATEMDDYQQSFKAYWMTLVSISLDANSAHLDDKRQLLDTLTNVMDACEEFCDLSNHLQKQQRKRVTGQ